MRSTHLSFLEAIVECMACSPSGRRRLGFQGQVDVSAGCQEACQLVESVGANPCGELSFLSYEKCSSAHQYVQYIYELLDYLDGEPSKTADWNVAAPGPYVPFGSS